MSCCEYINGFCKWLFSCCFSVKKPKSKKDSKSNQDLESESKIKIKTNISQQVEFIEKIPANKNDKDKIKQIPLQSHPQYPPSETPIDQDSIEQAFEATEHRRIKTISIRQVFLLREDPVMQFYLHQTAKQEPRLNYFTSDQVDL